MLRYLTLVAAALFLNAPAPAVAEPLRITLDQVVALGWKPVLMVVVPE